MDHTAIFMPLHSSKQKLLVRYNTTAMSLSQNKQMKSKKMAYFRAGGDRIPTHHQRIPISHLVSLDIYVDWGKGKHRKEIITCSLSLNQTGTSSLTEWENLNSINNWTQILDHEAWPDLSQVRMSEEEVIICTTSLSSLFLSFLQ